VRLIVVHGLRTAIALALVVSSASAEPVKPTCSLPKLERKATLLLEHGKTRSAFAVAQDMVSCKATPRSYAMLALTACKMFVATRDRRYKPVARRALSKLSATDQQHVVTACRPLPDCPECQLE
jgi:hypothetical protein